MMTQLKTKDKVALFILLLIGIAVAFYYLLFSPILTSIKELKAQSETLQKSYKEVNDNLNLWKKIDADILASKIKAEQIKPDIEYVKDIIKLRQTMETEFLSYTDKNKTEYYASYINDNSAQAETKKPKIVLDDFTKFAYIIDNEEKEKIDLPLSAMTVTFYTKQTGTDGLKDISGLLEKIVSKYHYMLLKSFTFVEPNSTGNTDPHYLVKMSIDIFLANGDFSQYVLGTCPHLNDDGTTCMAYNELTYSSCVKCKKDIDNCPNPNCNTLLTMDTTICTTCKMALKQCIDCNELILISATSCTKCFKPQ